MTNHLEEKAAFLKCYGSDAFKIIAAYEEACKIGYNDRCAQWFGDLGVFEAAGSDQITYEQLRSRYDAGLKFLGIIPDQVREACLEYSSSELAEHIRAQLALSEENPEYVPAPVLKMDAFELTKDMLVVDRDMDVDCDIGQEITAYLEVWFDVDKKFGLHINDEEDTWLNLYAKYNPFADTLRLECEVSRDDGSEYFDYKPTEAESQLIKDMIAEKIQKEYGQTPQEFCEEFYGANDLRGEQTANDEDMTIGGIQ